ncbi:small conductance mechanosensitive channel [Cetobacterium ceti]|uniref:Small conductance mechanosensitive channel n=1 Tax=Cetobacterium ceti TaxID=180163 RepID=A0A1T4L8G1_9FUSO|nr:mechanosensitive ion channel domain-containing protein [Cetobacterium ceti]SJZ50797.1 small conductance mechanosensitive channel [Cetobacterium ceti]
MKNNIDNFTSFSQEVWHKLLNKGTMVDVTVDFIYIVLKVILCLLIYYFGNKIFKKILHMFHETSNYKSLDESLKSFMSSVSNLGINIILITSCLIILGVKESSLIAFLGTIGIGIGLALKDNLSNFAGGIIILLFKTYKVGDEVEIADHMGYVKAIDIFCTSVRTHNNDLVLIPNGKIVSDKIINYTKTPTRRLKFIVSIGYDDNIDLARKVLEEMLSNNPLVLKDPKVYTHVDEYADSSINIALKGWCINENYWTIYKQTLNEIKPTLDKYNINIPYPQMDVFIKNK